MNPSTESIPPTAILELTINPLKGVVHKSTFNPRARAAQNYNIVEYLAQSPSAMLVLEVLQNCPSQKQTLLSKIGGIDLTYSNLLVFNHTSYVPQLPAKLAFSIQVNVISHLVHHTIIDEGSSTCIMSLNCWKSLSSPRISQSPTTLKDFNGCTYKPCGIINNLHVELGGKMNFEVEVIDRPLDYNILLERPWVYAMTTIFSTYFRMISFPHKGVITIINQLSFFASSSEVTRSVLLVHAPQHSL